MPQNDPTLLSYGFSTDPIPVAISTPQVTNQARVNIGVRAKAGNVYCNQILVAVSIDDSTDPDPGLFSSTPAGSVNTGRWSITSRVQKGRELDLGLPPEQVYATFRYDCISGTDYLIDYNLVLGLFGPVSGITGDAKVIVQEKSGTAPDPATFTPKRATFQVRKEWPQFYLKNLVATNPSTPTVPTTEFRYNAPIRLAWESNGRYFQLFQKDQTVPVWSGIATTCELAGGVSSDTTFILAASMTGSPGEDTTQGGYRPIYLYDSLSITVSNPVLTPTSVNVARTLTVASTSTLAATTTGPLTSASATVAGSVQAGSVQAGNVSATGSLTGTGTASLTNLTVTGLTGTGGKVSLFGKGVMLAKGTDIPTARVQALTDGIAMAYVHVFGGRRTDARAGISRGDDPATGGTWFYVQGGTVLKSKDSPDRYDSPNTLTVPIQAGATWSYGGSNDKTNDFDAVIEFWWYPIGSNGGKTFQLLSADGHADVPPALDFDATFEDRE
jgi:hypothetical protein